MREGAGGVREQRGAGCDERRDGWALGPYFRLCHVSTHRGEFARRTAGVYPEITCKLRVEDHGAHDTLSQHRLDPRRVLVAAIRK